MRASIRWLPGLLVGLALVLGPAATAGAEDRDRTVVVAVGVDATSMDPYLSTNITDKHVASHLFDTLLRRDDAMRIRPNLATSYRAVSPTVWEFTLRPGVRFDDGTPLTAEDVKFTIEHALDPALKAPSVAQFRPIVRVDAVGPHTVRITTKEPYPALPAVMAECWILSKAQAAKGQQALNERPVGSGPYRLKAWARGDSILLEARTDYWQGAPKIPYVRFRTVPDQNTRFAQLRTGEADIVAALPPEAVALVAGDRSVRIARAPGARAYFVGLNTRLEGPLRDRRVRQALNHAVDVQALLDFVYEGYGSRLATLLTPQQFGYTASVTPYPHDPAKAKALLAEAGFPAGFAIRMEAPEGRYPKDREVAQAIAGQLAKVGVRVDLAIREWGTFVGQFRTEAGPPMYLMGWSIPTFDPETILTPLLTPNQTYGRFDTPSLTRLIHEARSTVSPEARAALYEKAQVLMKEEAPVIFLFQLEDLYGVSNRLDWTPRSDERILLYQAAFR